MRKTCDKVIYQTQVSTQTQEMNTLLFYCNYFMSVNKTGIPQLCFKLLLYSLQSYPFLTVKEQMNRLRLVNLIRLDIINNCVGICYCI